MNTTQQKCPSCKSTNITCKKFTKNRVWKCHEENCKMSIIVRPKEFIKELRQELKDKTISHFPFTSQVS